jgi:hypothetical protein
MVEARALADRFFGLDGMKVELPDGYQWVPG